jgi:hypothetical protein
VGIRFSTWSLYVGVYASRLGVCMWVYASQLGVCTWVYTLLDLDVVCYLLEISTWLVVCENF